MCCALNKIQKKKTWSHTPAPAPAHTTFITIYQRFWYTHNIGTQNTINRWTTICFYAEFIYIEY